MTNEQKRNKCGGVDSRQNRKKNTKNKSENIEPSTTECERRNRYHNRRLNKKIVFKETNRSGRNRM